MMSVQDLKPISIGEIKVQKYNVRKHDIDKGIDDLAASIKAVGLLQPITVYYDSKNKRHVILAGQRRLNAYHYLNKQYPNKIYDKINCFVIPEPETDEAKVALSLAENITQVQMTNTDVVKAVTDLYNTYRDYDMVREKFGLTKYMIDKFVSLARLPERLKDAINEGEIHPNNKVSENAAIRSVNALQWTKGGDVAENDVLELAKEYAKGEIDEHALDEEARKGGSVSEIKKAASNKPKEKITIHLSTEGAAKLKKVAESKGEKEASRATSYVVEGVTKDYAELED